MNCALNLDSMMLTPPCLYHISRILKKKLLMLSTDPALKVAARADSKGITSADQQGLLLGISTNNLMLLVFP